MKVVIIGSDGFVGQTLFEYFKNRNDHREVHCIGRSFFNNCSLSSDNDILQVFDKIKSVSTNSPGLVYCVNLLSASNVDFCEKNILESQYINYKFPKQLFSQLIDIDNVRIVSFSSNAVYGGKSAPYSESSAFNPVNSYGEQKALLDVFLREELSTGIILRPTTLFGYPLNNSRSNPVFDLIQKAKLREQVKLVTDLIVNFGYVMDLCKAIDRLILDSDKVGEYNFGGPKSYSRYELGLLIYKYFCNDTDLVTKASMKDFSNSTLRPLDTTFDCNRFDIRFGIERSPIEKFLGRQN